MVLLTLTSLLFGSSTSLILTPLLVSKLPFLLLSTSIPSVSEELAKVKTFDFLDMALTAILSLLFFLINLLIMQYQKQKEKEVFFGEEALLLIFGLTIFIQTHFVTFSKSQILEIIGVFELIYLILKLKTSILPQALTNIKTWPQPLRNLALYNGFFLGFYLIIFLPNIILVPILPLLFFFLSLFAFFLLSPKAVTSFPAFLLLPTFLFPRQLTWLALLGIVTLLCWTFSYFTSIKFSQKILSKLIYPAAVIFLLVYNPVFFIGNYDSVEEGFFLGWVQRLMQGQVLYKDVAVYHPPLLIWGMYLFSKIAGFTIFSERLFLHLLQISGLVIYFFLLHKILKKTWVIIFTLLLTFSFTQTLVRNNIEIRLGLGLLALIFLFRYYQFKNLLSLFLAGFLEALTFFTSIEVGLTMFITSLISIQILPTNKFLSLKQIKINLLLISGIIAGSFPILAILYFSGGLSNFFQQIIFYVQAFSGGYFNTPIDRTISLSYFHWHIFDQYLASTAIYWETTRLSLLGSFIYFAVKLVIKHNLEVREKFIFILSIFGLILLRSSLGRSDMYHLLFILPLALITLAYLIEKVASTQKTLAVLSAFALLFIFARPSFSNNYLEQELFKFQTYSRVIGEYKSYSFPRGQGALMDNNVNTQETDQLVKIIADQTSSDDTIFVYPWMPQLYFFTNRKNATSFDTPYAFFSDKYQEQMISEIAINKPKLIVYSKNMNFGGLNTTSLPMINKYILENYTQSVAVIGETVILKLNNQI